MICLNLSSGATRHLLSQREKEEDKPAERSRQRPCRARADQASSGTPRVRPWSRHSFLRANTPASRSRRSGDPCQSTWRRARRTETDVPHASRSTWPRWRDPKSCTRHCRRRRVRPAQKTAEATLGQSEAVERRGVKEADAERPGALDCRFCIGVADRREQSAEGSRPEADRGDVEPRRKPRTLHFQILAAAESTLPPPPAGEGVWRRNVGAANVPTSTFERRCPWLRGRGQYK
jgi:hypothetical protein